MRKPETVGSCTALFAGDRPYEASLGAVCTPKRHKPLSKWSLDL